MTRVFTPVEVWNKEKKMTRVWPHLQKCGTKEKKLPVFRDSAKLLHKAKFVSPFDTWKKIKNDEGSL